MALSALTVSMTSVDIWRISSSGAVSARAGAAATRASAHSRNHFFSIVVLFARG
jgi:hypothetical protein